MCVRVGETCFVDKNVRKRFSVNFSISPRPWHCDKRQAYVAELQEQITELEEDNRVLMEASGWQRCDLSEVRQGGRLKIASMG